MKQLNSGLNSGKVLLSGASGMLGPAISDALERQGVRVLRLVRRVPGTANELQWAPSGAGIFQPEGLEGLSAAVHLSGANVAARRWNEAYKQEMRDSRVTSTRTLSQTLARLKNPPKTLITASAVGLYGDRGDEVLSEDSAAGVGYYFPELCMAWEAAAQPAERAGIRVVHLRFGMVIARDGGAMARLAPLFRLGLGGRLGSGRQWMSWVSEPDAVSAVLYLLEETTLFGAINVVAPEPVTNATFTRELARAVHRPAVLPAPAFALRLAFGEMADEALLASTRAVPKRLQEAGFVFKHPTLAQALAEALRS